MRVLDQADQVPERIGHAGIRIESQLEAADVEANVERFVEVRLEAEGPRMPGPGTGRSDEPGLLNRYRFPNGFRGTLFRKRYTARISSSVISRVKRYGMTESIGAPPGRLPVRSAVKKSASV